MNNHFAPDSSTRKDKRSKTSERSEKHDSPLRNQPQVKIWTVTLFSPKPRDKIAYYIVNPDKQLDIQKVATRMAELYGMNVYVYGNLFNLFDVNLEKAVEFSTSERVTLQVLSEFDG